MARRCLVSVAAACLTMAAAAQSYAVGEMIQHVRFAPHRTQQGHVALVWADTIRFEADIAPANADDSAYGTEIPYRYYEGDSLAASGTICCSYAGADGFSLVLRVWGGGATMEAGAGAAVKTIAVWYDRRNTDSVRVVNPDRLRILRHSVYIDTIPAPRYAHYASTASLRDSIAQSDDANVCFWKYLDRNTDSGRAIPGGSYTIATVADGRGSYSIVYISGATAAADEWQALRIKGRLAPAGFLNHYDLEWLDAYGRPVPQESFADIDPHTGILTLNFPLLNSSMRFRRLTGTE